MRCFTVPFEWENGDAYFFQFLFWLPSYRIFAADGPEWRYQRKLASHIFTVKAFKEYVSDVFVTEGQKVIDYLGKAADQGTVVDFHLLMLHFTLDSFGTYVYFPATCTCTQWLWNETMG